jgi:hypothetical protein
MSISPYKRPRISSKYLEIIGEISVNVASTESAVLWSIFMLIDHENHATTFNETLCLVGGEPFDILLSKLQKLFLSKVANQKLQDEFAKLYGRLDTINKNRNTYIHSTWVQFEETVHRSKTKKRMSDNNSRLIEFKPVSLNELETLANDAFDITDELISFITNAIKATKLGV